MKKGFTLLEMLIVVSIISLLVGIGITSYTSLGRSARDARRKADLEQMRGALELYRSANGAYPSTSSAWWGTCSGYGSKPDTGATGYIPGLAPTYIARLPHDPREGVANTLLSSSCAANQTCYLYYSNGTDYKLLAHCTVETTISANDQYQDPHRPAYSYAVWSTSVTQDW